MLKLHAGGGSDKTVEDMAKDILDLVAENDYLRVSGVNAWAERNAIAALLAAFMQTNSEFLEGG